MDLKNQTQKRTIKFRIFNKKIKSYIDIHSSAIMIDELNNLNDNLIVEQFTGLHDKNGKEIYKGEILYNNDRKEHCIVKYSKEKAMFIVKYLESNDEFPLWESISNLCYSVGNLYENPELLEKKFAD